MKSCAFTFARMNPVTTGHMKLMKKLADQNTDEKFIYLSHTQDKSNRKDPLKCKNPLPYEKKIYFVKKVIEESGLDISVIESPEKTVIEVLKGLYEKGYKSITLIVGSDRIEDMSALIEKYNGVPTKTSGEILFDFEELNFVSSGDREEEDEVSSMSASKMRKYAVNGDWVSFQKGVPTADYNLARDLYEDVRIYMGANLY